MSEVSRLPLRPDGSLFPAGFLRPNRVTRPEPSATGVAESDDGQVRNLPHVRQTTWIRTSRLTLAARQFQIDACWFARGLCRTLGALDFIPRSARSAPLDASARQ